MLIEKTERILLRIFPENVVSVIIGFFRIVVQFLYYIISLEMLILKRSHPVFQNPHIDDSILEQSSIKFSPSSVKLSIIIPAYNARETLERCLKSVVNQHVTHSSSYEVLVVDDGSTDSTKEIMETFQSNAHVTLFSKKNGGFSSARNFGLTQAHGKYVYFLDSDDYLLPGALEEMLRLTNTDTDLIQFSFQRVRENLQPIAVDKYLDEEYVNVEIFDKLWSGYPWAKLIKRPLMMPFGFPEGYWFEDTIFPAIVFPRTSSYTTSSFVVQSYVDNPKGITRTARYNSKTLDHVKLLFLLFAEQEQLGIVRTASANKFWQAHISTKAYSRIRKLPKSTQKKMLHEIHGLINEYPDIFDENCKSFRSNFLQETIHSENLFGWTIYSFIG